MSMPSLAGDSCRVRRFNRRLARLLTAAVVVALGCVVCSAPAALAAHKVRPADTAGASPVGTAHYPVPSGAVFAAPSGSDSNPGTSSRPVRTITRAVALAPVGGTVVLRRGVFHESVTISKRVTLQNYPYEPVSLDGSVAVTGWSRNGSAWVHTGWNTRFDASVGYTKGAVDGTTTGWQWLRPEYPMAAHPDQVFIGSEALRQVGSRAEVRAGTFFLDNATSALYLGSDPTAGVRASTLATALRIQASGTVVRGIEVRRYSPSIWHIGSVLVDAAGVRLEQVTVNQSATIGIGVTKPDVVLTRVSVLRSGLLGIHASQADRLVVRQSRVQLNNTEHFNHAPVSGGIKVTRTRTVTVSDSLLLQNDGPGYWSDESTYDTRLLRNNSMGNRGNGLYLEISAKAMVVDNLVLSNAGDGIKVSGTSSVQIWNNTITRNARTINLVQGSRRYDTTTTGHDPRYVDDPTMTWLLGPVTVRNNVVGLPTETANCVLCVEDFTHQRSAAQMGVTSNGNVFNRASATSTRWLSVWSRGAQSLNPAVFTTLATHQVGTHQDATSLAYDGRTLIASGGDLAPTIRPAANARAQGLPNTVAYLLGRAAGVKWAGAFGRR